MGQSGHIDWHNIARRPQWVDTADGTTFVYAFWTVDYTHHDTDHGVALLKGEGRHPDWFVHSDRADHVLFCVQPHDMYLSANYREVYGAGDTRSLLGAVMLGSIDATFALSDRSRYWTCTPDDLTRRGTRLVNELSMLYLRPPVLVTFIDLEPMKATVPGAAAGTATVS